MNNENTPRRHVPTPEEIEQHLNELFGTAGVAKERGDLLDVVDTEMLAACIGVLVKRAGGASDITQADLDDVDHRKLSIKIDPEAEKIALTLED